MICRYYGHCRRDPDTGEVLCHHGWRDSCPMEGVEEDEDGNLIDTNNTDNNKEKKDE